jgi:integrase
MATGIRQRGDSWEPWVWSPREKKKIRRTFPSQAAARGWRHDAAGAVRKGTLKAPTRQTLRQAGEELIAGMKKGSIRKRDGERFKPSVIRGYQAALENRVYPELGACRLSEIRRTDLQDFVDRLQAEELDPSTIRNAFMPVRTIYRRALRRAEVAINPTLGLEFPALEGKRDRIASPEEAERLLAALPEADRPLWATAFYAGLRMGELRALDWSAVDLAAGIIRVEHSWDRVEGLVEPKSRKGSARCRSRASCAAIWSSSESAASQSAVGQASSSARRRRRPSTTTRPTTGRYESGRPPGSSRSACTRAGTSM